MRTCLIAVVGSLVVASAAAAADAPTFYKDVLPILQANCQTCHRPGEVARCRSLTYEQARPGRARSRLRSSRRQMPPWFADPGYAQLANERRLVDREIDDARRVGRQRSAAGDPADGAAALTFHDGWNIKPDVIVEMPKPFDVPARGTVNYKYIVVNTNFKEDMWVTAAEMRPGDPAVLHHGKVWVRPPGSKWMERAVPGEAYESESHRDILGQQRHRGRQRHPGQVQSRPRRAALRHRRLGEVRPEGIGPRLRAALHHVGKPAPDVSKLGLVLAKEPPQTRYFFHAGPTALNLAIPPGDGKAEVVSEITFGEDARLVYAQPHMHLRGKDFELRVVDADGPADDGAEGQLELRVADGLSVRRADRAAEGIEAAARQPLRQLDGQSLQPRSGEEGRVGSPELG